MDARGERARHTEIPAEVDLSGRDFFFIQGVTKKRGDYRVSVIYKVEDRVKVTYADGLFMFIEMARSVRDNILEFGIEDDEDGLIAPSEIIEVRIDKKQKITGDYSD